MNFFKRKYIAIVLLLAITIIPGGSVKAASTSSESSFCYTFTKDLYASVFTYLNFTVAHTSGVEKSAFTKLHGESKTEVDKLHQFLKLKNYELKSSTVDTSVYGIDTATAIAKFQKDNNLPVHGYFDSVTRAKINSLQNDACLAKAKVDLTYPNGNVSVRVGEKLTIKYTASKVPGSTQSTISYVKSTVNGLVDFEPVKIADQVNIDNGEHSYDWVIPSTLAPGEYKILVQLTGSTKSDMNAKTFTVKEKATRSLIVTKPTITSVVPGGSVGVEWIYKNVPTSSLGSVGVKLIKNDEEKTVVKTIEITALKLFGLNQTTSTKVTIPTNTESGSYRIEVWTKVGSEELFRNYSKAFTVLGSETTTKNGIMVSVSTDKNTYKDTTDIKLIVNAKNVTSSTKTLKFGVPCPVTYTIVDQEGGIVFDSAKNCTQSNSSVSVIKDQKKKWELTHKVSDKKLVPGIYTVKATIDGYGTASTDISVIGATASTASSNSLSASVSGSVVGMVSMLLKQIGF